MDSKRKSLAKALSWRAIATFVTTALGYGITRDVTLALSLGAVDALVKILAYYVHERAWANVGRARLAPAGGADKPRVPDSC